MDVCNNFQFSLTGAFHECRNCKQDRRLHTNAPNSTQQFNTQNKPAPMPQQHVPQAGEVATDPLVTVSVKDRIKMMNSSKKTDDAPPFRGSLPAKLPQGNLVKDRASLFENPQKQNQQPLQAPGIKRVETEILTNYVPQPISEQQDHEEEQQDHGALQQFLVNQLIGQQAPEEQQQEQQHQEEEQQNEIVEQQIVHELTGQDNQQEQQEQEQQDYQQHQHQEYEQEQEIQQHEEINQIQAQVEEQLENLEIQQEAHEQVVEVQQLEHVQEYQQEHVEEEQQHYEQHQAIDRVESVEEGEQHQVNEEQTKQGNILESQWNMMEK